MHSAFETAARPFRGTAVKSVMRSISKKFVFVKRFFEKNLKSFFSEPENRISRKELHPPPTTAATYRP